jgi:hypothetical protein
MSVSRPDESFMSRLLPTERNNKASHGVDHGHRVRDANGGVYRRLRTLSRLNDPSRERGLVRLLPTNCRSPIVTGTAYGFVIPGGAGVAVPSRTHLQQPTTLWTGRSCSLSIYLGCDSLRCWLFRARRTSGHFCVCAFVIATKIFVCAFVKESAGAVFNCKKVASRTNT